MKTGPGRPAHNAHPQSCSGDPIPPDEIVKRDKDKKEKKLRKQLERQVKRLQQSKVKPGVNTATLTEAIHQTLTELRAINCSKEAKDLVGSETYTLLVDTLNIDVIDILRKVIPMAHHQRHNNNRLTASQNKSTAFSIENLLSSCGNKQASIDKVSNSNQITQPVGFIVNASSPSIDYHDDDDDDDDSNSSNESSVDSEFMSPNHEWASSPELDVTDDADDFNNANELKDNNYKHDLKDSNNLNVT